MSFKRLMIVLGAVVLVTVIALSWGCQNQPTGPGDITGISPVSGKTRASIVVRARGTNGSEHINLKVGGSTVGNWTLSTSMSNYSASTNNSGSIEVCFDNDGTNRDVQIDYITVDGSTRQAENQSTNTGVWQNSQCGGSNSEWLHCNGCINFGNVSGGGSTTTTTSGGSTTTTTSGGSSTTTTNGGGSNTIVVRARGTNGSEHIYLTVGGNNIGNWTLSTSMSNYSASTSNTGGINLYFDNDGTNRDVQVDYITVNGSTRQAENQSTNTGVWQNSQCGGSNSEWLHCNGYIGFGDVSGGGTSTTTTSGGSTTTTTSGSTTTTTTSGGGGTKTITSTIRVNGGTYDGGGERIIAQGMGDGSQDEDQDPIFRVENGTVRNVRIAAPGCDGIHCYGNCRIENVTWEDVGEDALTVKGQGDVTVSGGSATNATDKMFQLNAACTFTVQNFSGSNFGCFIRQNGGTSFTCNIYLNSVTISNGDYGVRTDASSTQIYYRNLNASNIDNLWKVPNQSQVHTY